MDECLQGWCTDPFERHEARWMSEGVPTALVRDGDVEAQDPPPDEPFKVAPVRVGIGGGVVDADERDTAHAPERAADAAWDAFGQTMS